MDPSKQDDDDIPKSKKVRRRRSSLSLPHPNMSDSSSEQEQRQDDSAELQAEPETSSQACKAKKDDDDILNSVKEETCDREEVLKYSCQLTLDPNTVNRNLWLSEENRKVEWHKEKQPYPHHPQRFQSVPQVLCTEGLSGTRCYWEIEWSGDWVVIGVAYKGIDKLGWGLSSGLGCNVNSWTLNCSGSSYTAWHNHSDTEISAQHSPRIGVYLDYPAGTLSFYRVSPDNIMTLLHRFQTTFTEPLYPAFKLDQGSTVTICQLR